MRDGVALVVQPFRPGEPVYLHETPADDAPPPDPTIRPGAEGGAGAHRVGDFTFGVRAPDGTARWEVGVVDAAGWTVFENPLRDRCLLAPDGTTPYASMEGFDYDGARYLYRLGLQDALVDPSDIVDPRYHAAVEGWRTALDGVDRTSSSLVDPGMLGDPTVRAPFWGDVAIHEDADAYYVPSTERDPVVPTFYRLPKSRWTDVPVDPTHRNVPWESDGVVEAAILDPDTRRETSWTNVVLDVEGRLVTWGVGSDHVPIVAPTS